MRELFRFLPACENVVGDTWKKNTPSLRSHGERERAWCCRAFIFSSAERCARLRKSNDLPESTARAERARGGFGGEKPNESPAEHALYTTLDSLLLFVNSRRSRKENATSLSWFEKKRARTFKFLIRNGAVRRLLWIGIEFPQQLEPISLKSFILSEKKKKKGDHFFLGGYKFKSRFYHQGLKK